MDGPVQYLHFGFMLISLANLIVIALLIVVFMLTLALRRPEKQHLSTLEAVPKAEEARERDLAEGEVRSVPRRWYWNSSEASLMR
jgi:uncharacterized membrane protein